LYKIKGAGVEIKISLPFTDELLHRWFIYPIEYGGFSCDLQIADEAD